jgi:hypothetical protein
MSPIWKWPRKKRREEEKTTGASFSGVTDDKLRYSLTGQNGSSTLVVMCPDGQAFTFPSEHPNFKLADELAREKGEKSSEEYRKLFDVEQRVRDLFGVLTDRVRVAEGIVYFDEKPVHNVISDRILAFMEEGRTDFTPLAKFMENIEDNPNAQCRETLFEWLEANSLAIDEDGFVVCFKGVKNDYTPSRTGPAIVNGVDLGDDATIHYTPGNIISIAREKCNESAAQCSTGLHVANRRFADTFNSTPKTVEVRVNPRDVVSVRLDGREKIRCCRLRVVGDAPPASHFNSALRVGV